MQLQISSAIELQLQLSTRTSCHFRKVSDMSAKLKKKTNKKRPNQLLKLKIESAYIE